jgi:glutaminyl-tRNA synthetase
VEPSIAGDPAGTRYQFERLGYFITDREESTSESLVFNRIVTLRDTWGRRRNEKQAEGASGRGGDRLEEKAEREGAGSGIGTSGEPSGDSRAMSSNSVPGKDTGREARDQARQVDTELAASFTRFRAELGLGEEQADILTGSRDLADFFARAESFHGNAEDLANWTVNELLREVKDTPLSELPMGPEELAELVRLLSEGTISQPVAKEIFAEMVETGVDPRAVVRERGLERLSDRDALGALVEDLLVAFPKKVEDYQGGKSGLLGFFTGQIMRKTEGRADPQVVQEILKERLDS